MTAPDTTDKQGHVALDVLEGVTCDSCDHPIGLPIETRLAVQVKICICYSLIASIMFWYARQWYLSAILTTFCVCGTVGLLRGRSFLMALSLLAPLVRLFFGLYDVVVANGLAPTAKVNYAALNLTVSIATALLEGSVVYSNFAMIRRFAILPIVETLGNHRSTKRLVADEDVKT